MIDMENQVTYFMWYMYNKWSKGNAIKIFGDNLGNHIWNKWIHRDRMDVLMFYSELDSTCRNMLVEEAINTYTNK